MGSQQHETAELSGKLAVVIGASSGIGLGVAEAFSLAGARVVIAGRSLDRLAEARAGLDADADIDTIEIDVASPESSRTAAAMIEQKHGTPTILFNSAGFSVTKPALDVTVDEWDAVHDVQLRGTFFACQAFAKPMAAAGYGKIINVSSTWAATAEAGRSVYCAAKAGVGHLTTALGIEWAPLGVRVNAIGPTSTVTPTIEARLAAAPGREEHLRSKIPMGRLATVDDMVGASVFLASPASDFITGQTLFVDGGWVGSK